jgi:hypothetical protein
MIKLRSLRGQIIGQVLKDLWRDDIKLLASNLTKSEGTAWQCAFKCRKTSQSFPAEYQFMLGIFDAFQKDPYFIELSEAEARAKLKAWGFSTSEADALINTKLEVE